MLSLSWKGIFESNAFWISLLFAAVVISALLNQERPDPKRKREFTREAFCLFFPLSLFAVSLWGIVVHSH